MENESHQNGPNRFSGGSPESPCLKSIGSSNNNDNKEQDRFLPIANVGRIMKKVILGNGKISKEAKGTVQECVSEFISFVTGEASDKCQREKRKTINGDDIIWAITTLGFEDYVAPLKLYISKYRENEGEKLNIPKQQRLEQKQQQHQQEHHEVLKMSYNTVYPSTTLMSHRPFLTTDHQPFPLPFSPTSIQTQLQQQDQIDSLGHWNLTIDDQRRERDIIAILKYIDDSMMQRPANCNYKAPKPPAD